MATDIQIEESNDNEDGKYCKNNSYRAYFLLLVKRYEDLDKHLKSSEKLHFLVCCAGVFFFYLIYGFSQVTFFKIIPKMNSTFQTSFLSIAKHQLLFKELLFSVKGVKPYGWYITMVQFLLYSVFGFTEFKVVKKSKRVFVVDCLAAFLYSISFH